MGCHSSGHRTIAAHSHHPQSAWVSALQCNIFELARHPGAIKLMLRGIQLWGRRHQETPHLLDQPNKTQQSPRRQSFGLGVSVKAQQSHACKHRAYLLHSRKSANKLAVPCCNTPALNRPSPIFASAQALAPAPCIIACSVQALAPSPGELTSTTPPHRSSLTHSTQAAGHQDQGEFRRGFGRLRHRCALRAILPLLRREPSCSTSPGQLPARSLRELASS